MTATNNIRTSTRCFISRTNSLHSCSDREKEAESREKEMNSRMGNRWAFRLEGNETVSGEQIERWSSRTYFAEIVSRK